MKDDYCWSQWGGWGPQGEGADATPATSRGVILITLIDPDYQSFPLPILRVQHKSKHTWAGTMIQSTPQTVYTVASEQRMPGLGAAALLH